MANKVSKKAAIGWSVGIACFFAVIAAILLPMFLFGNKVVISYYLNGKEITQVFDREAKITDIDTPKTEEGYYFDGWYADSNLTVLYEQNTVFKESTTIYPKISPKDYYTIFYFSNNKSNDVFLSYELFNATILTQTNPWTTEGFDFVGWSEDKNAAADETDKIIGENEILEMESSVKKLYAVWEEKNIQIEFEVSEMLIGESQANFDVIEAKYGDVVTLPNCSNVTNKNDSSLTFGGFLVDGVFYQNGSQFVAGTSENTITVRPYWVESDAYLYLNIENPKTGMLEQYSFNVTQYAVEQGGVTFYTYNLSLVVDSNNMTISDIISQSHLKNYNFVEYKSGTDYYTLNSSIETSKKIYCIDALYQGKERKLELYNGEELISEHNLHYGEKFDLPEAEMGEFLFLGYSENNYSGEKPHYSGEIFVDFEESVTKLYADFKMSFVHFNSNGGFGYLNDLAVPAYTIYTFTADEKQTQRESVTRKYYTLTGWSENKSATMGSFTVHTLGRRITMYAIWKRNSSSVNFYKESGAIVPNTIEIDQGSYYTFTKEGFAKPGYYLIGFEYEGETYSVGESIFVEEDSTFIPIWSENEIYFSGASVKALELYEGEEKKVSKLSMGDKFYLPSISSEEREKTLEDGTKVYFAGWSLDKNAKSPDYFANYDMEVFDKAMIFYAIYMPETEGVSFYGSSATIPDTLDAEIVVIPSMHNGVNIASCSVGYYANPNIKYLIVGNDITLNGSYNLSNLKYAAVGDSLNIAMFSRCKNLEAVSMSSDAEITQLPSNLFNNCEKLKKFSIPKTVTEIDQYVFHNCKSLNNINIPENVERIEAQSFSDSAIEGNLVLPDSLEYVAWDAFTNCKGISSVTILGANTEIETSTFSGCSGVTYVETATLANLNITTNFVNIQKVKLLEGVTEIPNYAFKEIKHVLDEELILPSTVTSIGGAAFENCDNLTKVIIPEGVTSIGGAAFSGCVNISELEIPSTVITVGTNAFKNCFGVTTLKTGYLTSGSNAGTSTIENPSAFVSQFANMTKVELLDGIAAIPERAFSYCYNLTEISVPGSVTNIADYAFYQCNDLIHIEFSDGLQSIGQYAFSGCKNLQELNLPNSLTTLNYSAFSNCIGLEELDLPSNLTNLGQYAFSGCSGLKNVNYSENLLSVGSYAFSGCTSLSEVIIPNTITSLGSDVFNGCTSITKAIFEDGLQNTGNGTFSGCVNLSSVTIPDTVTSLGAHLFYNCDGLTEITIPNSVTSIGTYAFQNCDNLNNVIIPEGFTSLSNGMFSGCTSLTNVTIPDSVTSFGYNVFSGCVNLTEIKLPDNITSLGNYVFNNCESLASIEIPDGVKTIGSDAFKNCFSLTEVVIPLSVTSVGADAFSGCDNVTKLKTGYLTAGRYSTSATYRNASAFISQFTNLKEVELLEGLTTIGDCTFYNRKTIKKITLPSTLTSVGEGAFLNTSIVKAFKKGSVGSVGYVVYGADDIAKFVEENGVLYIKNSDTDYTAIDLIDETITDLTFNPYTTSIANYAFYELSNLKSVTLPNSLTSVGTNAFYNSSNISEVYNNSSLVVKAGNSDYGYVSCYAQKVYVDEENSDYIDINGVLYFKNSENDLTAVGLSDKTITNLVLDSRTTSIQSSAFSGVGLLSVTIPENVTSIGSSAFYNCSQLYEVFNFSNLSISVGSTANGYVAYYAKVVSKNADSGYIFKDDVFYKINSEDSWTVVAVIDKNRVNIDLDSRTTSIGYECFKNSKIESLIIPEGVTYIGSYAFSNCSDLTEITIPDSVTTIESFVFQSCSNLTEIKLPDSISIIGQYVFRYCSNLQKVEMRGVKTINDYDFYNCSKLKTLILSDELEVVRNYAFYNCSSLTSFVMPNTVTTIGHSAFYNCSSLTEIRISSGITSIGAYAFYGCSKLSELLLPEGVNSIGEYSFSGCTSLTEITFPSSLTNIYNNAFRGCTSLECVTLPGLLTSIGTTAFLNCSKLTTIYNNSALELTIGSTDNGYVAFYATVVYPSQETDYVSIDGVLYYKNSENNFTAVGLSDKTITDIVFDTRTTAIKAGAFRNCENLVSVTIPASIENVGVSAFAGCLNIRKLRTGYLGNGGNTFIKDFSNLMEFELLEGLKSIPEEALMNSNIFGSLVIPSTVTSIGSAAFSGCKNLTGVIIPDSVTSIGQYAFRYCESLTEITIPSTVTSVGTYIFSGSGLRKLTTGYFSSGSKTYLNNEARYTPCSLLSGIPTCFEVLQLLDNVTDLGEYSFAVNVGFEIIFPSNLTSIENFTFENWTGLTKITIPDTITSIGVSAFSRCTNLKKIVLPAGLETLSSGMFYACDNLVDVVLPDSLKEIKSNAFEYCISLKKIRLPNGLTSIGDYAFYGCSSLESITIPASVKTISSHYTFNGCEKLKTVYNNSSLDIKVRDTSYGYIAYYANNVFSSGIIEPLSGEYVEIDGVRYCVVSEDEYIAVGLVDKTKTNLVLDSRTKKIAAFAFENCVNLHEVTIPAGVTAIDDSAFSGCTGVTVLKAGYLPAGYYKTATNDSSRCSSLISQLENLERVEILEGVSSVDICTFFGCSKIKEIILASSTTSIGSRAFAGCSSLERIELKEGLTGIASSAFSGCRNLREVILPSTLRSIGDTAFSSCTGLTRIDFNEGLTSIGYCAFEDCRNLAQVNLPSTLISVTRGAFSGCENLFVVYNNSVLNVRKGSMSFGGVAYYAKEVQEGESEDRKIEIDGVLYYKNSENDYTALELVDKTKTKLILDSRTTEIAAYAFRNCDRIFSLTIPEAVTSISAYAFEGCMNLYEIYNYSSIEIVCGDYRNGYVSYYAKAVYTANEESNLIEIDGVIYYKNSDTVYIALGLVDKTKTKLVLDSRTTEIAYKAFYGCDNLVELTIPYGVETIGNFAFYGCDNVAELRTGYLSASFISQFVNLNKVEVLEGVTTIGTSFSGCDSITEISLPKTLTLIGASAFSGCDGITILKTAYFDNTSGMKDLIRNVVTIEFLDGVTEIGDICLYDAVFLENVIIPEGVTTIKSNAFFNCVNLTNITLPSTLTHIENGAFLGCVRLAEIYNNSSLVLSVGSTDYGYVAYYAQNIYQNSEESAFVEIDGVLYYKNSNTDYIAMKLVDQTKTNLVLNSYTTEISEYAFAKCNSLIGVEMPNSITKIGEYAFSSCENLTNVILSENIMSLENGLFAGCGKLQEIILPNSITTIGDRVFANCASLTEIIIPNTVNYIGIAAFANCKNLTEINLTDGTEIMEYAFAECRNLTDVSLPNDIIVLNDGLFYNCVSLTNIVIPETLERIGKYVFAGCDNLSDITIPDSVTEIRSYAFSDCDNLASVHMGNNITYLDEYVFANCEKLTNINLSEGLTEIKDGLFKGCISLNEIELPTSITKIGDSTFENCSSLYSIVIPNNVVVIGEYAFRNCVELTFVTMSNSVEKISKMAFYKCYKLIGITLPATLTLIDSEAFNLCYNLFEIYNFSELTLSKVSGSNGYVAYYAKIIHTVEEESSIVVIDGIIYFKDSEESYIAIGLADKTKTALTFDSHTTSINQYAFRNNSNLSDEMIIPEHITNIGLYAFENCIGLTKLTFMDGVKIIGSGAFRGCIGLTEVTVPNSVTSANAFQGCSNVTKLTTGYLPAGWYSNYEYGYVASTFISYFTNVQEVVLLDGVTSVGEYTFYRIISLKKITLSNTVTSIGGSAFSYCSNLVSVVMTDSVESIGASAFYGCSSLTEIILPTGITTIGDSTFYGCSSLIEIIIPESVTSIGNRAFSNCSQLEEIIIPKNVTTIGSNTFSGCTGVEHLITSYLTAGNSSGPGEFINSFTNLRRIELLENITTIPNYAFYNFKNLTSVVMANSVTSIGQNAFYGCENLSEISLSNCLTSIGNSAFSGCKNLKEINLPNGLISIGQNAFYGSGLTEISIPEGVTAIQRDMFNNCTELREINLPSTLTTIGSYSIANCSNICTITIPQSVTTIESGAFANCYKLIEVFNYSALNFTIGSTDYGYIAYNAKVVHTTEEDSLLETIDGITYFKNADDDFMVFKLADKTKTSITFDSRVKSIYQYAFYGCDNLTGTLQLPDGIEEIPQYAFYGCTGLNEIILPESVTKIGQYAFYGCTALANINLPSGLTSIGKYAFYQCEIGGEVIVSKSMYVGEYAFGLCKNITAVTVYQLSNISKYAFSGCQIKSLRVGNYNSYNGIEWIADSTLSQFSSATTLEIMYGVTKIDALGLRSMVNVNKVILPTSLKTIERKAFSDCDHPSFFINSSLAASVAGQSGYRYSSTYQEGYWHYDEDGRTPILWS